MKKASDLFIEALENEGVEYIFGVPGEENLDLLESIRKSKIQLVVTRHEQGAGFMAATYGRLTGKLGVCLSTLGPGATNLVTPAAYAQLGAMPILMITGQKPIKKSKQGRFQIIDVVDMFQPLTKFTTQIVHGNSIPSLVREAFRVAVEERPGAVHLELPEDIAREETNEPLYKVVNNRHPSPDEKTLEEAVSMICAARMPLILIGAGANRKRTSEALKTFINQTQIPFFTTQMGKGVVDDHHELCLGTAALSSDDYIHYAIEKADLIINVGHDVIEKPPFFMQHGEKKVIHINFFPANIDQVYFPDLDVEGDIATSIRAINQKFSDTPRWDFSFYRRVKQEVETHISRYSEDTRFPLLPQRIVKEVQKAMPTDGIVALDNGIYKIWFARNYKASQINTLLLDNALASMGAGLPSGIAAKLINPNKQVVVVCGDGGFMMNSQEVETAVRLKMNIVVIILNDNAYGMIKWKQEDMNFDSFGLDYNNPDFVKYAESYGAFGHKVGSAQDFTNILNHCLQTTIGVHIINCPVDYSLNHEILNVRIKEKAKELE